jgi:hypothetical protein
MREVTMSIAQVQHDADPELVTVNFRYVGRVADDRDRWVIELPAGTTIKDGSILHVDDTVIDISASSGKTSGQQTLLICDAGPI